MRRGLLDSRAAAQRAIDDGLVLVGGVSATKAASLVDESVSLKLAGEAARFVSRGGEKLEGALAAFPIAVQGRRAVDVGASTGGFTDCLLQRGAATVVAVDVGYGQLDWKLRSDDRVRVVERCNIRHADPAELGAPFDLIVTDLSFISLRTVAPALAALGGPDSDHVYLVKPQFEVGKGEVGKGGIVRDDDARVGAVTAVIEALEGVGLGTRGLIRSPITGAKGNVELLAWLRAGATTVEPTVIDEVAG